MKLDEFAFANQQLAGMLESGLPLEGALRELCGNLRRGRLRDELAALEADLAKGEPLAEAIDRRRLPDLYRQTLRIGARSTRLPALLTSLADHYSRMAALTDRARILLVYPVLVLCVATLLSVVVGVVITEFSPAIFYLFQDWLQQDLVALQWQVWIPTLLIASCTAALLAASFVRPLRRRLAGLLPGWREVQLVNLSSTFAPGLAGIPSCSNALGVSDSNIEIKNSYAAVQDHTRVYKDFTFVYPVISRRSGGLSIGVNLNPDKVCNFDCIYCEVDRGSPGKVSGVDLNQMKDELTAMIRFARDGGLAHEPKFDELPPYIVRNVKDIAFSGDGEPTMIKNFDLCVEAVAEVKRTEGLDQTKIVLITDAAGLDTESVRRGLKIMDENQGVVWGKLDAGTEDYYRMVNRTNVKFSRILANLTATAQARPIIIQSLFLKVHDEPMPADELAAYCGRLNDISAAGGKIEEVHLYTVARPTPEKFATRLTNEELADMAKVVRENTGLSVLTFD